MKMNFSLLQFFEIVMQYLHISSSYFNLKNTIKLHRNLSKISCANNKSEWLGDNAKHTNEEQRKNGQDLLQATPAAKHLSVGGLGRSCARKGTEVGGHTLAHRHVEGPRAAVHQCGLAKPGGGRRLAGPGRLEAETLAS
jgi:hypothetical protein